MSGWRSLKAGERWQQAGSTTAPPELVPPLGQGAALARLLRQARGLLLPHGLVIEGAPGTGKTTVAGWLAAALLCEGEDPAAPCGSCPHCRQVAGGGHAALQVLTVPADRREIPVESVREVIANLQRTAITGRARVLCIDPAERLNEHGQNTLLKTLEEPGNDCFLLLSTARPEQLLPTVRSRVQRLRVLRLPAAVLRQELLRRAPDAARFHDTAVALADGALGRALEWCTERAVQLHDLVRAVLADGQRLRPVATARAVLAGARDGRDATAQAREFLAMLRAELRASRAGPLRSLESAGDGSYALAADSWTVHVEAVLCAEEDLDRQIPAEQALTGCLVRMQVHQ